MPTKIRTGVIVVALALVACIDEIELAAGEDEGTLVVEGLVTNEVGPSTVRLSRARPFNSDDLVTTFYVPERNAVVTMVDNQGEIFSFCESAPGVYVSEDTLFQGIVGRSYTLDFTTADGKEYQSYPETLLAAVEIDTIMIEFLNRPRFSSVGSVVNEEVFAVTVASRDPVSQRNFYKWKVSGILEYYSITENPMIQTCWANFTDLEDGVQISHDRFFDGNLFSQRIGYIPYRKPTRYMVKVSQYSMTEQAFIFWDLVNKQQHNTGGIFDPTPAKIKGNVHCTQDIEETVLGYFGVSAIDRSYVVFDQFKISRLKPPSRLIPALQGDCREHQPFGHIVRPEGF